jgi:hypothetical protein
MGAGGILAGVGYLILQWEETRTTWLDRLMYSLKGILVSGGGSWMEAVYV